MADHAKLSASSAKMWLTCTPSANLEEQFKDSTNIYAEEGTQAHSLAEMKARHNILRCVVRSDLDAVIAKIKPDHEMDEVTDQYIDILSERLAEAKSQTKDAELLLEQRLDFSHIVPEGFGTGDAIILADGVLEVVDLKYGKGIPVSAIENPQARLYALGALNKFGHLYDIHTIRSTIVQPRIDNISTEEISVEDLEKWGEEYVKPRAIMADQGKGEYVTGEHCRFCKAKAICRARAEEALTIVKHEFQLPPVLSDDEIPEILDILDKAEAWIKDIRDYAYTKALSGMRWDGWKLVEGRSNRTYIDETLVAEKLIDSGMLPESIYDMKLKGITAMEKILGKKKFEEQLSSLVIKPSGKPTLVPESDRREELNSVSHDFKLEESTYE